jgi:prolyl-tRNA synthetase
MRYSQLFGKTSKTITNKATAISHKLLLQGGFINQLSAGRYTLLPLGFRVAKKVEAVIRKEVEEKTGAQELIVPTLHPLEIWQKANRDKKFGAAMMKVVDRNGAEFTLGATAEVIMMDLVNQSSPTYKDLPINIYQFSQKFRDEARPTGGLLRTREFVMKDGYSFHENEEDLIKTYNQYWKAYEEIAKKLGLDITVVESDNGAIGGSVSHEFMVETDVGEDTIAKCSCGYAANLERAEFVKENINLDEKELPLEKVDAVRGNTMEDGVKLHHKPLNLQIKDVVYVDDTGRFILAIIRGDYSVNETKLQNLVVANELRHATDEEIQELLGSEPGFISPIGIKNNLKSGVDLIVAADDSLKTIKNAYGGSNQKNIDLININFGRDYTPDLIGDIAQAEDGFYCPKCKKWQLRMTKAVEFGNIFNIGFTYSKPMNGTFVDKNGNSKLLYMGSYGIGIGRAISTIIEKHHDDKGIIWPESVAPYQIHLVGLDLFDEDIKKQAEDLYQKLLDKNIEVLFDDRIDVTAGAKFADADLIGIPTRLVISKRSIAAGGVEFKKRSEANSQVLSLQDVLNKY